MQHDPQQLKFPEQDIFFISYLEQQVFLAQIGEASCKGSLFRFSSK